MNSHKETVSLILHLAFCCCLLYAGTASVLSAAGQLPNPPIQVGGSADALHDSSVTDAEIGFKLIFNEILAKGNESFDIQIYSSNEDLVRDFKAGKIQAVFFNSLRLIELGNLVHPTGRYVVQFGPSLKQRYLLLVHSNKGVNSLKDLRNRKLSTATGHILGEKFLDVELLKLGLPVSNGFFSKIERVKEANSAVIDLFFGKVDAALVPEFSFELACELNPQIKSSLSVLTTSDPMIHEVVGMRFDFPKNRLEILEHYILEMDRTRRLDQLFQTFRITGIVRADENSFKEVMELNEAFQKLSRSSP